MEGRPWTRRPVVTATPHVDVPRPRALGRRVILPRMVVLSRMPALLRRRVAQVLALLVEGVVPVVVTKRLARATSARPAIRLRPVGLLPQAATPSIGLLTAVTRLLVVVVKGPRQTTDVVETFVEGLVGVGQVVARPRLAEEETMATSARHAVPLHAGLAASPVGGLAEATTKATRVPAGTKSLPAGLALGEVEGRLRAVPGVAATAIAKASTTAIGLVVEAD